MPARLIARWGAHREPRPPDLAGVRSLRWLPAIALAVLLAGMTPASSSAQSTEAQSQEAHSQEMRPDRCATPEVSELEMEMVESRIRQWQMTAAPQKVSDEPEEIDVYFHVVHAGREGRIPRPAVRRQVRVMNKAFEEYGFRFRLREIDYKNRSRWFYGCGDSRVLERMKRKLSRNPETEDKVLDIYSCGTWFLGEATFPWYHDSQSSQHGIVIRHTTFPKGSEPFYDLGFTAVHEVGHWLGLYHTFQSFGMCDNGDKVSDTPRERDPAYGCPIGRNSCPNTPGLDPIDNFMNYSDDACMERFTPLQAARMQRVHRAFAR